MNLQELSLAERIALIERELAARAPVAVAAEHSAHGPSAGLWSDTVPVAGSYTCGRRGCKTTCARPGVCAEHGAELLRQEAAAQVATARASIPVEFRWASAECAELTTRSFPVTLGGATAPGDAASRVAAGLISGERRMYTLWGPTKAGKTSFACAALSCVLDAAEGAFLAVDRSSPADRLAPVPAEPRLVTLGRASRFIRAMDLQPPKERGPDADPPAFGLALTASLLVLDDCSQENSGREDSAASAARAQATREVLLRRWDDGKPTIVTLPYGPQPGSNDVGLVYGGGVKRRLFDDSRSRAIEFRRPGGKT